MAVLDVTTLQTAFERLNDELGRRGVIGELAIVGGAVMCLVHQARPSTRDVDAWFVPAPEVRAAADVVGRDLGLPDGWLNDGAKGFFPESARFETWREFSHLRLSVADAGTMLAMKLLAARSAEDRDDIRFLADRLGVRSVAEALDLAERFYARDRIPLRAQLILEELFDDRP